MLINKDRAYRYLKLKQNNEKRKRVRLEYPVTKFETNIKEFLSDFSSCINKDCLYVEDFCISGSHVSVIITDNLFLALNINKVLNLI